MFDAQIVHMKVTKCHLIILMSSDSLNYCDLGLMIKVGRNISCLTFSAMTVVLVYSNLANYWHIST